MEARSTIAVDARFTTVPMTGVQRYAYELVARLSERGEHRVLAIVPPWEVRDISGGGELHHVADSRYSGGVGHAWEQAVLPVLARRAGADLLLSPANWGPIVMRRQLPVIHDAAPLFHPEFFDPAYVRWARAALPRLTARSRRVGVTCERVREELVRWAGADRERIDVIPPGVGSPFADAPVDPNATPAPRCVFVGGHDVRKNLAFVRELWPRARRELGLELHVVSRSWTSARRAGDPDSEDADGVVVHTDVDDEQLVELYRGALCLLWPSSYEGYGLPLLEAMAVGTPFLSTDTGAARELAPDPAQVLPLDASQWFDRLRSWRNDGQGTLRHRSLEMARVRTWARSAETLAGAIERAAA